MRIVSSRFDHPDAVALNDVVQQEYAERYDSEGDLTPLSPEMFTPPAGRYLLVYDEDGRPVGTGGWRAMDDGGEGYAVGDAEIKRMFVIHRARRRGLARRILSALEEDARAAGRSRMVLETGNQQPEAVALYTSSGYRPVSKFGYYRFHAESLCFGKPLTTAVRPETVRTGAGAAGDSPLPNGSC